MVSVLVAIGSCLDRMTMHRLTLLSLLALPSWAVAASIFGLLDYPWWEIAGAGLLAVVVALAVNQLLARLLRATTEAQSTIITGLIVAMLVPVGLAESWAFLVGAAAFAAASKYVVTVDRQHIFNPAVVAVAAIPMLFPGRHANWWIGTEAMLPAVVLFGGLIVFKTRRGGVVATFLAVYALASTSATLAYTGELTTPLETLRTSVVSTALLYFAFVMLTDPITIPSGLTARHSYAAFVAILYATPFFRFLPVTASPEVALCIANAVSFVGRPKYRLALTLVRKTRTGERTWAFDFTATRPVRFRPGQFMEWTVPHRSPDGRGQRRYFTIASSPTESELKIVVRVPEECSTFKRALVAAEPGTQIVASRLAGDFVLPRRLDVPLAFLAGGVGVAPFRSMARYIVDNRLRCDIVMLYWCHRPDEFLFQHDFDAAVPLGMRSVCLLTGRTAVPAEWRGKVGVINGETVQREIPDYATRTFYLSGSHPMVSRMHAVLRGMGVGRGRVRKDYFDGLVDSDVPLPRVSAHGSLAALKPWGERRRSLAPLKAPENAGRNP